MTKYEMIVQDIKDKIASREYQSNQVIPSEAELCEIYGVSRITVRKALETLIAEDVLYRVGRKGSFVRDTESAALSHIYSFTEEITRQGKKPSKKQIALEKVPADSESAAFFGIAEGDMIFVLQCLYLADGVPYCLNTARLPEALFPKLEFFDFNDRSLYEILKSFYGLTMTRARQRLSAVTGTPEINAMLCVDEKQPLLHITATSYCREGGQERAFELYDSYILTDVLDYSVEKFH